MSELPENAETPVERFARLYGTPERGARLWSQWMETQTETTRGVMENVAATVAEERGISIDEARTFLAIQKLLEDRGPAFVTKFLREHDNAEMQSGRTLRPMAAARKRN
ncbi:MAG: hypothetical protein ACKO5K_12790 [Armatimonadota bacterium]